MNTPQDIYNYVVKSGKESDFLSAILLQKQNYSIAEIGDTVFCMEDGVCRMQSGQYKLNLAIQDEDIVNAVCNHLYITAFISRHGEQYQVHFLVHRYPTAEKAQFEEEIAQEVVRYMILKTIVALRLTTWKKVDEYVGQSVCS